MYTSFHVLRILEHRPPYLPLNLLAFEGKTNLKGNIIEVCNKTNDPFLQFWYFFSLPSFGIPGSKGILLLRTIPRGWEDYPAQNPRV